MLRKSLFMEEPEPGPELLRFQDFEFGLGSRGFRI